MSEWRDISTVPYAERVIVFVPSNVDQPVLEAMASPDGEYWHPDLYELDGVRKGATMWQPLPEPPTP